MGKTKYSVTPTEFSEEIYRRIENHIGACDYGKGTCWRRATYTDPQCRECIYQHLKGD